METLKTIFAIIGGVAFCVVIFITFVAVVLDKRKDGQQPTRFKNR